jgi:outer membrane protein TolC
LAERQASRAERGEASGLEAHRLRLAASALRSRVALAEAESERARAEAATWNPDLPRDARPALPDLANAPTLDGSSARIIAAEADVSAARLARQAAGRFVASPEVSLGWQRQEAGAEAIDGPIFGLAWSVPLFDRKRAARDAADASIAGAQARLELVQREVIASRAAAAKSFARLAAALAQAREELTLNGRMLDGAEAAFLQGEAELTDLLETHRSVTEAELAMLDLYGEALAVHRQLERLAGPAAPEPAAPYPSTEHETTSQTQQTREKAP